MDHKPICMKEELKDDTERFCACNDCDPRPMKKKVSEIYSENPCSEIALYEQGFIE